MRALMDNLVMPQESNTVRCPNCAHELDVNDILYKQLDDELRQKYEAQLARKRRSDSPTRTRSSRPKRRS